jgi:hypothetical protein
LDFQLSIFFSASTHLGLFGGDHQFSQIGEQISLVCFWVDNCFCKLCFSFWLLLSVCLIIYWLIVFHW